MTCNWQKGLVYGSAAPSTVGSQGEDASNLPATPVGCGCWKYGLCTLCTKVCSESSVSGGTPLPIWNYNSQLIVGSTYEESKQSKDAVDRMFNFASQVNLTICLFVKRVWLDQIFLWTKQLEAVTIKTVTKVCISLVREWKKSVIAENMTKRFLIMSGYWSWYNNFLL